MLTFQKCENSNFAAAESSVEKEFCRIAFTAVAAQWHRQTVVSLSGSQRRNGKRCRIRLESF